MSMQERQDECFSFETINLFELGELEQILGPMGVHPFEEVIGDVILPEDTSGSFSSEMETAEWTLGVIDANVIPRVDEFQISFSPPIPFRPSVIFHTTQFTRWDINERIVPIKASNLNPSLLATISSVVDQQDESAAEYIFQSYLLHNTKENLTFVSSNKGEIVLISSIPMKLSKILTSLILIEETKLSPTPKRVEYKVTDQRNNIYQVNQIFSKQQKNKVYVVFWQYCQICSLNLPPQETCSRKS